MAKKVKKDTVNTLDGEMTMEELEALEAEKAKKKKKGSENPDLPPDTGPVTPPTIPDNPGDPAPEQPTDHTGTVIITGDPENPEIIIVPAEPETPLDGSESVVEPPTNTGGTDGSPTGNNA